MAKESSEAAREQDQGVTLSCPCGTSALPVVAFQTPTRRYCRCPSCGLVFRHPRPAASEVHEYYREQYDRSYGQAEAGPDRGPVFDSVLAHLSGFRRPPGRLLDVGCGDGGFLLRCRDQGWTCFGLELSREAAKRAMERGLTMLPSTWLEARSPGAGESFDVIALVNVLETVSNPMDLLRRVPGALAPGGLLVMRVSNGRFHLGVRRPAAWLGLRYQQAFHYFVYTPRALAGLVRLAGLEVVSVRNSRPSLAPLTLGHRWLRRAAWRLAGGLLWALAQGVYLVSGQRAVWAPSFEVIARRR